MTCLAPRRAAISGETRDNLKPDPCREGTKGLVSLALDIQNSNDCIGLHSCLSLSRACCVPLSLILDVCFRSGRITGSLRATARVPSSRVANARFILPHKYTPPLPPHTHPTQRRWRVRLSLPNIKRSTLRTSSPLLGLGTRWSHWLGIGAIGLEDPISRESSPVAGRALQGYLAHQKTRTPLGTP